MLNEIRPGLRLINGRNDLVRVEVAVQPGEGIEVPAGSVTLDRSDLTVVEDKPRRGRSRRADSVETADGAQADVAAED